MIQDSQVGQAARKPIPKRAVTVYVIREVLSVMGMALLLFWPAGRLDWGMGWALLALWAAWVAALAWIVIHRSPELLMERLGAKKGSKSWDAIIQPGLSLLTAARCVVGGFDQHYGWTTGISLPPQLIFLFIGCLGGALFIWAAASNPFFSQVVRIQSERGQTIAQGGPYRSIRHPGYAGSILMEIAAPMILGSWWALIPSGAFVILMVVRTALEDRALQAELPGYPDYAQKVKYRLVPGIW